MVKLFFFLLTLGSMKCGPLNLTNVTVTEEEVVDNGGEGIHQHPEAVAGDLNKFLNAIQSDASSPTQKHPKDLRLGEGVNKKVYVQTLPKSSLQVETEAEVSSEIEVKEAEESSEVVVEEVSGEGVEEKKSTGVVEEQFLENMKNYNNLKDALTSLSSDMDQVHVLDNVVKGALSLSEFQSFSLNIICLLSGCQ